MPPDIKRWLSNSRFADRMGFAGLIAFSLGGFTSPSLRSLGLALLLIAFVVKPPIAWSRLIREPMIWLLGLSLVYLAARTWWAIHEYPDTRQEQLRYASIWASLWLFVVVARWVEVRRIPLVLGLALAGLIIGVLQEHGWSDLSQFVAGTRGGFGYGIPQAGLYSATAVIGLLAFAPGAWKPGGMARLSPGRIALWSAVFVLMVEMLLITQSRISWIAVVLTMPLVVWFAIRQMWGRRYRWSRRQVQSVTAVIVGLVVVLAVANHGLISGRVTQSITSMESVSTMRSDEVAPVDPFALRMQLYRHGLERWSERPFFGWGPGARLAPGAESMPYQIGHFHNTYLELLVRLGLVGVSLVAIALLLIGRVVWIAYQEGRFAPDHFAFVIGGFLVLAIWSAANFRLGSEVRFLIVLLCAVGYSAAWQRARVGSTSTATLKATE